MYIQTCTYIHACTMYSAEQMQLKGTIMLYASPLLVYTSVIG